MNYSILHNQIFDSLLSSIEIFYFYSDTFTEILDFTVGRRSPPNNPKSIEELDISG